MDLKKAASLLNNRISRNILFWLLFAFFHLYPRNSVKDYLLVLGFSVISYGIPVYVNNLVLIPHFLLNRKYFLFALFFLALLTVTITETYYVDRWAGKALPFLNYANPLSGMGLPYHIFHILLLFTLTSFSKFLSDAVNSQHSIETLQKQRLEAELEGLRSQINPHFLFNALNTIYGMARRTDKKTADAVLTLSDILRHNIYETKGEYVGLEEEISLIKQYVAFAQLRLHQKDTIRLFIDAEVMQQRIAPLLLLPFIENAIKHGLDKYVRKSCIDIELTLLENDLFFICSNYSPSGITGTSAINKGIGLKNVQRRLQLCYPGRHVLRIDTGNDRYTASLKINLL